MDKQPPVSGVRGVCGVLDGPRMGTALRPTQRPELLTDYRETYLDLLEKVLTFSLWPEPLKPVAATSKQELRIKLARLVDRITRTFGIHLAVQERPKGWPVLAHTMLSQERIRNVRMLCDAVEEEGTKGSWVECGVWRGGASIMARATLRASREVILCDTFTGLPYDALEPQYARWKGLAVSKREVLDNFSHYGLLDNVRALEGRFCDTLPNWRLGPIAILRADGDMYSSTMDILTNLYHHVTPGGFVIVDDYNWLSPCKRAVTEFLSRIGKSPTIIPIDNSGVWFRV